MKHLILQIIGMKCLACELVMKDSILHLESIKKIKISYLKSILEIWVEDNFNLSLLIDMIKEKGFVVKNGIN